MHPFDLANPAYYCIAGTVTSHQIYGHVLVYEKILPITWSFEST